MKSITSRTGSAITVLNAMKSGIGAAIGIREYTDVRIEEGEGISFNINPSLNDFRLVEAIINEYQTQTGVKIENITIQTDAPFPPAMGMKTSSSVANGLIEALNRYFGIEMETNKLIGIGAEASINAGVSITGAFDDAYASYLGGLAYTNNEKRELLGLFSAPENYDVVLLLPDYPIPKVLLKNVIQLVDDGLIEEARESFEKRRLVEAIQYNTAAYASVFLPDPDIITRLEELSCEVIGLNGGGPAMFAITKPKVTERFVEEAKELMPELVLLKTTFRKLNRGKLRSSPDD